MKARQHIPIAHKLQALTFAINLVTCVDNTRHIKARNIIHLACKHIGNPKLKPADFDEILNLRIGQLVYMGNMQLINKK